MVKQLSKARPTINLLIEKAQKEEEAAVNTPPRRPTTLEPIRAGILPHLSATHPQIRPPAIAPTKNRL